MLSASRHQTYYFIKPNLDSNVQTIWIHISDLLGAIGFIIKVYIRVSQSTNVFEKFTSHRVFLKYILGLKCNNAKERKEYDRLAELYKVKSVQKSSNVLSPNQR